MSIMDDNDQLTAQFLGQSEQDPISAVDVHEPFTKVERFHQLTEIDQDVTTILEHTGNAIKALAKPQGASSNGSTGETNDDAEFDPQQRLATFKEAMDAVMVMLHSVDTRLKRQIYGLEEAGIITLPTAAQRAEENANGPNAAAAAGAEVIKASLKPNGVGKIGTLDVGILNANNSTMERDMESELWTRAREHLESVAKGPK